jgi:hypothetical protein
MTQEELLQELQERKKTIIYFIENLPHKRFTKEELEELLSNFFNAKITLSEATNEWDGDYRVTFDVNDNDFGYIFFDIWYLELRKSIDFPNGGMYITEVSYDFNVIGSI